MFSNSNLFLWSKRLFLILIFVISSLIFRETPYVSSGMSDYCYTPPFIGTSLKPNVLIVMDFSGSMQFPAYVPCNFTGYSNKVAQCGSSTYSYNPNQTYSGYFDSNKCYQYSSSFFQEANCDCSNRIGSSTCISGNLLNWVTTTRIDVARMVLTGGRTSQSQGNTFLESEGAEYTIYENSLKCRFTISATTTNNRVMTISNNNGTCPLGNNAISDAQIRIRPSDPNSIRGIIHSFCDTSDLNGQVNEKCKLIIEFMVFASDGRYGEIKTGKNTTLASLISAINNELPYYGTPTGEALWEAYDFYKQSNDHNYEANSAYINRENGNVDPYYDGSGGNATPVYCRKGFVLLISDGAWNGNIDPVVPARQMLINDLRPDLPGKQNIYTYTIYAFGDLDPSTKLQGRQAMITTALFGGFEDLDSNTWPFPFTGIQYPTGSGTCSSLESTIRTNIQTNSTTYCNSRGVTYLLPQCNPPNNWNQGCAEWDTVSNSPMDGLPYNFYEADDAEALKGALLSALSDILRRASSGATVATLSQGFGSGALMVQPYFFPSLQTSAGEVSWIGSLRAFWIDFLARMREDTNLNKILEILGEFIDKWIIFGTPSGSSTPKLFKITNDTTCSAESFDDPFRANVLFDVGCRLANASDNRRIYINLGSSLTILTPNDSTLVNSLASLWNASAKTLISTNTVINSDTTKCIINYLIGSNSTSCPGGNSTFVSRPRDLDISRLCGGPNVVKTWKLGDIVYSTPTILSYRPLGDYHLRYGDSSYLEFIRSDRYRNRNTYIFVGANDGMLHAFRVGRLIDPFQPPNKPLRLVDAFNANTIDLIGKEEWAFIPRNALPYLVAYGHKDWCHIFTTDMKVYVFDAKINNQWRTLLLGTMGFGGREINLGNLGNYSSSIYLLDLTDWLANPESNSPTLLWEITLPDRTLTLSSPHVIKVGDTWYVIIGSGPKYISGAGMVSVSYPSQPKVYFINLNDGAISREIDLPVTDQAVGAMRPVDYNNDYSDDLVYFGTYNSNTGTGKIFRINLNSTTLAEALPGFPGAPIISAPDLLLDESKNIWVFFGTGTYFGTNDNNSRNYFVGFRDKCAFGGSNCTTWTDLGNRTNYCNNPSNYNATIVENATQVTCIYNLTADRVESANLGIRYGFSFISTGDGWYHNLDSASKESMYSDVLAMYGMVYGMSFKQYNDPCKIGGESYVWEICYKVGCPCWGKKGEPVLREFVGPGSPPLRKAFVPFMTPGGRLVLFTQTSAGMPLGYHASAPSKLFRGRYILWIEK